MAHNEPRPRHRYKELSLQQLRSFCEVCRHGGYAPAARELLMTGPAIWEQSKALEGFFKMKLLERHGNGVRPTLHGKRLLELARPVLAELDSAKDVLQQEGGALPEQITIASNLRILAAEISQAMSSFRRRYPNIRLRVRYLGSEQVQAAVLTGQADVTLTLEPGADDSGSSVNTYESVGELDYLLVTPPRHALQRKQSIRIRALTDYPLVLGETGAYSRQRVQEVFHRHNLLRRVKIAVETSSDEYTLSCVRAGLGVGIAIGKTGSTIYRGLGVRSLKRWFGTARVGFMWRRGAHVPPIQRELAELIQSCTANCD